MERAKTMDYTTTKQRLGGYTPKYLKIARNVVWFGLAIIVIVWGATAIINDSTEKINKHMALKEIIYQNIKHK